VLSAARSLRFQGDPPQRLELEARLLAGETFDAIAEKCGVPADVGAAYEAVFFNVSERLQATDYILSQVIGERLYVPGALRPDDFVKFSAYRGGPYVVDAMRGVIHGDLSSRDGLDRLDAGGDRLEQLFWRALATRNLPVDDARSCFFIMRLGLQNKVRRWRKKARSGAAVCGALDWNLPAIELAALATRADPAGGTLAAGDAGGIAPEVPGTSALLAPVLSITGGRRRSSNDPVESTPVRAATG
jgi:hypothetical protein